MATGTIKRLVRERGFGFVLGQDGTNCSFIGPPSKERASTR